MAEMTTLPGIPDEIKTILDTVEGIEDQYFRKIAKELRQINALSHLVSELEKDFVVEIDKIKTALKKLLDNPSDDINEKSKILGDLKRIRRGTHLMWPNKVKKDSSSRKPQAASSFESQNLSLAWQQPGFLMTTGIRNLESTYHNLESHQIKLCLLSFSIFPENSVIKKRPLIYWWIGEGFIDETKTKTAEEVGEAVFEQLIRKDLITPEVHDDSSPVVNKCSLHPWIHRMLILLAKEVQLFEFISKEVQPFEFISKEEFSKNRRVCLVSKTQNYSSAIEYTSLPEKLWSLFNVSEQYLNFKPKWLTKLKMIEVLQLGQWQADFGHHIEVVNEELLKGLGAHKNLKYLSLRGISRITELPPSIVNLTSLEILDLKACYNLETLPDDIALFRKLTHLDVSECYLLERMPKGIDTLDSLQVLKGFLIGSSENTPCRLADLRSLKRLRRLSIYIGNDAEIQGGQLDGLEKFSSLRCLTITWALPPSKSKVKSKSSSRPPDTPERDRRGIPLNAPPDLHKLDLRSIPQNTPPDGLNPNKLKNLKKLYIRGGELSSFDFGGQDKWTVQILRLNYLKKLTIDKPKLEQQFPHLLYLENKELKS